MTNKSVPVFNTTNAVLVFLTILCLAHALRFFLPAELTRELIYQFGFSPAAFASAFDIEETSQVIFVLLTPFTHTFLHADIFHLLMNIAFYLVFGTIVERRIGSLRVLVLFFLSAGCGTLFALLVHLFSNDLVVIIGASGGVSGLFGAFVRYGMRNGYFAIISFIGINIIFAISGLNSFENQHIIAWDAHIGGFLGGWALFPIFDSRLTDKPQKTKTHI